MRCVGFLAALALGLVLTELRASPALAAGQLPDGDRLALASVHAAVARAGQPELLHVMVSTMGGQDVITVLLDSFGTHSPVGDAGRVRRWLETGDSGQVAGAARRYEQEKTAAFAVSAEVRTLAGQSREDSQ